MSNEIRHLKTLLGAFTNTHFPEGNAVWGNPGLPVRPTELGGPTGVLPVRSFSTTTGRTAVIPEENLEQSVLSSCFKNVFMLILRDLSREHLNT